MNIIKYPLLRGLAITRLLLAAFIGLSLASSAALAQNVYSGPGGTSVSWTDPSNWSAGHAPTPGEAITISPTAAVTFTGITTGTYGALSITGSNAVTFLSSANSNTLTFASGATAPTFTYVASAPLVFSGTFTNTGTFNIDNSNSAKSVTIAGTYTMAGALNLASMTTQGNNVLTPVLPLPTLYNASQLNIQGNMVHNSGAISSTYALGTLSFNGSSAQTLSGTNSPLLNAGGGIIEVNNANGVTSATTNTAVTVFALKMTSGTFTINSTKTLTINSTNNTTPAAYAVQGGSSTSYIVAGSVARAVNSNAGGDYIIPTSLNGKYVRFILNNPYVANSGTITSPGSGSVTLTALATYPTTVTTLNGFTLKSAIATQFSLAFSSVQMAQTQVTLELPSGNAYSINANSRLIYSTSTNTGGIWAAANDGGRAVDQSGLNGSQLKSGFFSSGSSTLYFTLAEKTVAGTTLSGTKTIAASGGDYTSLTAAVAALNASTVSGDVTFELDKSYTSATTETYPIIINPIVYSSASAPKITFRPASNVNTLTTGLTVSGVLTKGIVTGTTANNTAGNAQIVFNGCQNVTFDGRPGGAGSANNPTDSWWHIIRAATTTDPTILFQNDAKNCALNYMMIGGKSGAAGNQTSVGVVCLGSGAVDGNDNVSIFRCKIFDPNPPTTRADGFPGCGVGSTNVSLGAITDNVTIQECYFDNVIGSCQNANRSSYVIFIANGIAANAWKITGNHFFASIMASTSGSIYANPTGFAKAGSNHDFGAVYITTGQGNGFEITNNYIGGTAPKCQGDLLAMTTNGSNYIRTRLIQLKGCGPINGQTSGYANKISGNIITNISAGNRVNFGSTNGATGTGGLNFFLGIEVSGFDGTDAGSVTNNYIGDATQSAEGSLFTNKSINLNMIGGVPLVGTFNSFSGINLIINSSSFNNVPTGVNLVDGNTIGKINATGTSTATVYVYGINAQNPAAVTISNNKIGVTPISNTGSTPIDFTAINLGGLGNGFLTTVKQATVYNNQIYNTTVGIGPATSTTCNGIAVAQVGTGGALIYNNYISLGHSATASTAGQSNTEFAGIRVGGLYPGFNQSTYFPTMTSTTKVYYNTVLIDGSAVFQNNAAFASDRNTYAFSRTGAANASPVDVRNNIFANKRDNTGASGTPTAKHYALNNELSSSTNTGFSANNNLLFSGTSSTFARYNGTDQDFATWQSTSTSDAASVSADPQFQNSDIETGVLLPDGCSGNISNKAAYITDVLVDFNNSTRPTCGSVGSACASGPAVGAVEFSGTAGSWSGSVSTDWNDAANWCGGNLPAATDNVTIPAGKLNYPTITGTASANNITILSGGSVTVGAAGTLKLGGTISGAGTFSLASGSTIEFTSTQSITIPNYNYSNVTLSGGGTKSLGTSTTVNQLTVSSGTTFNDNDFNLTVKAGITNNGTITSNGANSTGKIILSGSTATQSLTGTGTYGNVQLSDANGATLATGTTFKSLTITAGTLFLGGNTTVSGAAQLNSGATIDAGANTLTLKGSLTNGGTISGTGATVTLTGGSAAHSVSGTGTLPNLTINDANGANLTGGTQTLTGSFTLTSGPFNNGGNTLNVAGDVTVNDVITGTGALVLNGTAQQNIGSTSVLSNLTVTNPTSAVLTTDLTVNNNLNVSTGTLDLGSNTLSLNGTLTGSNLLASSTSGINFGSASAINFPSAVTTLGSLVVNQSGGAVSVTSDLSVSTLTLNSGVLSVSGATLTKTATGNLNINAGYIGLSTTGFFSRVLTGNSTFVFPVGPTTQGGLSGYRPLTLNGTVNTTVKVGLNAHAAGATGSFGVSTTGNNRAGFLYRVIPTASFNADFTLEAAAFADFNNSNPSPVPANTDLVIYKSPTAPTTVWTRIGQSSNGSDGANTTVTKGSYQFAAGDNNLFVIGVSGGNDLPGPAGPTANTWKGTVDNNWSNGANWNTGAAPVIENQKVTIATVPGGFQPTISSGSWDLSQLTINPANTITQTGGGVNVSGTYSNLGAYTATGGTFSLNGAASQVISGNNTFANLTLSNTSATGVFISSPTTVTGNLNISGVVNANFQLNNAGGNAYFTGANTSSIKGNFNLNNVNFGSTNANGTQILSSLTIPGTVTLTGTVSVAAFVTLNATANTLNVSGTGNPTLAGSGTFNFGSVSVTAANGLNVGGTATVNTTGTTTISKNLTGSGTFANAGTVTLNSSSAQTISGGGTFVFNNLVISNTSSAGVTLGNNTTVKVGGVLSLGSSSKFNLAGQSLVLTSSATGTGSIATLANPANLQNATNVTMQRWVNSLAYQSYTGAYFMVATPITGKTVNNWAFNNPYTANTYNQATTNQGSVWLYNPSAGSGWYKPANASVAMPVGSGGRIFFSNTFYNSASKGVIATTGSLNKGNTAVTLGYASTNGWNIVGNPYPSEIDWELVSASNPSTVGNTIYIWRHNINAYATYQKGGTATLNGSRYIPSSQSFMVQATGSSPSPVITFTEAMKVADANNYLRTATTDHLGVRLTNGNHIDETVINFKATASRQFAANEDALKLTNSVLNLSTAISAGNYMAINTLPAPAVSDSLVLVVNSTVSGIHKLSFYDVEALPNGIQVFLKDNLNGSITPVQVGTEMDVVLGTNAANNREGRFVLLFATNNVTGLGASLGKATFNVYPNPSVTGAEVSVILGGISGTEATIRITDLLGKEVYSRKAEISQDAFSKTDLNLNLPAGIYSVSAETQGGSLTQKLVIK